MYLYQIMFSIGGLGRYIVSLFSPLTQLSSMIQLPAKDQVVTEFAQVSFFQLCFVSLVKTWRAFNCQVCNRRGRVVCLCNASVQLK